MNWLSRVLTSSIGQKLIAALDALPSPSRSGNSFILYLPEGESQELSLLFLQYLIRKRGFRTLYLGLHTSLADLGEACRIYRADHILTIISETFARQSVHQYLADLRKVCPDAGILLTGYQVLVQGVSSEQGLRVLQDLNDMQVLLDEFEKSGEAGTV